MPPPANVIRPVSPPACAISRPEARRPDVLSSAISITALPPLGMRTCPLPVKAPIVERPAVRNAKPDALGSSSRRTLANPSASAGRARRMSIFGRSIIPSSVRRNGPYWPCLPLPSTNRVPSRRRNPLPLKVNRGALICSLVKRITPSAPRSKLVRSTGNPPANPARKLLSNRRTRASPVPITRVPLPPKPGTMRRSLFTSTMPSPGI